jgi:hypothetical protein
MITRIGSTENPTSAGGKSPDRTIAALKRGEVIRGEVLRDLGRGEVLVRSGGATFRAVTRVPVREGERYDFLVKIAAGKDRPAVLGRAAPHPCRPSYAEKGAERIPALVSELTSALSAKDLSANTSAILRNLTQALPSTVYGGPGRDPASWLSRFVAEGGLFWEGKVARSLLQGFKADWRKRAGNDLKGMLLDLKKSLKAERQEMPEIETAGRKVDEALDLIQKMQLENRDLIREEGCWYLFVPGRTEEGFNGAELYLRRNMKEKETRFSMLLDFTHLGPTRVTASILESTITVRFEVSDEQKAERVRTSLPLLERGLKDQGLLPGPLVCVVGENDSEGMTAPLDSINLVV